MISHDAADPMLEELRLLRPLAPDPTRAERVRARCRTHLERTRRSERSARNLEFVPRLFAALVVGCLCGLYITGLLDIALRLHGMFD